MTGLRYSPLHVTELCGEMHGKFKVGRARLINGVALSTLHATGMKIQLKTYPNWRMCR